MKLDTEFIRLPLRFDAVRLTEEIAVFEENEWRAHPTGFQGNSSLILISKNGEQNDQFSGPMKPAPALERCPYIKQVLASFQTIFGRSRLMRLSPLSKVPQHVDTNYHWKHRVRIHVPIITDPNIQFICNGKAVHMATGEAWLFDSWKQHTVINPTHITRVHLVADTSGTPEFWRMVEGSERPFGSGQQRFMETRSVPFEPNKAVNLSTELFTHPNIMSPGEVDGLTRELLAELGSRNDMKIHAFTQLVFEFCSRWRSTWSIYGPDATKLKQFQAIIENTRASLNNFSGLTLQTNGTIAVNVFDAWVLSAAINADQFSNTCAGMAAAHRKTGDVG